MLGFVDRKNPVYRATRAFVLSVANPFFFNGTAGEGVGGALRACARNTHHARALV